MLYTAVALRKLHGICSTRSTALLRHPANASFVQKIFHITECERKTNVQHHSQADDLRARFKVPEWGVSCHTERLRDHPARLNLVLSDSARPYDTLQSVALDAHADHGAKSIFLQTFRKSDLKLPSFSPSAKQ